jgi:hypothetical protein
MPLRDYLRYKDDCERRRVEAPQPSRPETTGQGQEIHHSLVLEFNRILTEAEWRMVVDKVKASIPFIGGCELKLRPQKAKGGRR